MEERTRRMSNKRRRKLKEREDEQLRGKVEDVKMVEDIRIVHDATSSGLNDAVWAPWFLMPTVE